MKTPTNRLMAFSLIELMVVLGIIALLIALLSAGIIRMREKVRSDQTRADMRSLEQAIRSYRTEYERWPGHPTGLTISQTWEGNNHHLAKYLVPSNPISPYEIVNERKRVFWGTEGTNLLIRDGWQFPLRVTIDVDNEFVRIESAGPDRLFSTVQDNLIHEGR